ncbi:uncharacterized protein BN709_01244 [Odoribacter laneus CAG:561]|uniref:oligosaccharide flippase family protein n=1 Tax=Odoribacter laneus TaxID=626933 RepID=UPI00033B223E|nr:oligosaccharide flippase family protein [Odoribacter laneus]CCZ81899.1 uncharacterized protein BN709_01244 [Odoribacter laneus CAG:561]
METNNTKQAAWIALGSLFSFGFGIVSSMILSRYFDKADYGTYKQVLYVYNTLLTVFTLGLPKAFSYFLPRVEIVQARSLIKKITNLFFFLGFLFSILLFVSSSLIASFLKNPDLGLVLKIFAVVPFLMLPTMGLEGILATYRKTKFMAIYTIVTRLVMLLCVAIPVMLLGVGYIGAMVGFVIASIISFILALYFKYLPVKGEGNKKCDVTYTEIFKFSLPLLYASLWGTIIASSDQFFISRYFGNEVFAEFSNGFMELPFIGMITGACATVLSPIFAKLSYEKLNPQKQIFPIWISVFKKTAMLIYPLIIYCWIFADIVMVVLYGQQYESSYIYFRIKLVANFFTLIVYAPLIINIGKVKFYSNVHMVGAVVLVCIEYMSIRIFDSSYAIAGISVVCLLGRIYCMLRLVAKFFNLKMYQLFPVKLIALILLPSILFLFIVRYLLINTLNINYLSMFIISSVLYAVSYFIYTHYINLDYLSLIKPLIRRR